MTQISRVIERAMKRLRIAQSLHAAVYSEDTLIEHAQSAFDYYYYAYWWPAFRNDITLTLDGTTGRVVESLGTLTRIEDIRFIWPQDDNADPLALLPDNVRPTKILANARPQYYLPDAAKVFRTAPFTAEGTIDVQYYTKPASFDIDSVVEFDETLLVLNTLLRHLTSNAANAADMQLVQAELNEYWRVYHNRMFDQDIATRAPRGQIPLVWQG